MTYTIEQAARLVGVSAKTLKRWEADGRYEVGRSDGGHRQFEESDIEALKMLHGGPAVLPKSEHGEKVVLKAKVDGLMASKLRAYKSGYPEPDDVQLEFRRQMLAKGK